jgi:hypothetical protein
MYYLSCTTVVVDIAEHISERRAERVPHKRAELAARRFVEVAHGIVWCTLATVDRLNRPRSRVVHPLWEERAGGAGPVGWVTTRPTPLKLAHLDHSPFVSCSYWDARHDVAVAECHAAWVGAPAERRRAWDLIAATPPPVGHDPAAIWPDGPESPGFALLRLDPWRLRVARAEEIAAGTGLSATYEPIRSGASLSSAGTGSPTTFQ